MPRGRSHNFLLGQGGLDKGRVVWIRVPTSAVGSDAQPCEDVRASLWFGLVSEQLPIVQ